MNPEDIRRGLPEAAELAGPFQSDSEWLTRAVRRRRRTRSALAAGAVLAVAGAAFTLVGPQGTPGPVGPTTALPAAGGAGVTGSASVTPTGTPWGQTCGRPMKSENTAPEVAGLTMSVSSVRRVSSGAGPAIDAVLDSEQAVDVNGSPAPPLEVLYLKDGVVVGGGFAQAGRGTPPAEGTLGPQTWMVQAGRPYALKLQEQNTLCPSETWPRIWAHPGDYEVVLTLVSPVVPSMESTERVVIARSPLAR